MVPEALYRVVGDGRGGVVAVFLVPGREGLIVEGVGLRGEMAVVVVEAVGVEEAVRERLAVYVPFARVVRTIAERGEVLG